MRAEIARAGEGKGETRMQSVSIESTAMEQVATDLRDTQARLSDVLPKLVAVREQLQRARVRAPVSGQVVGLSVFTIGGVVAPGQTLMEIVPDHRNAGHPGAGRAGRRRRRLPGPDRADPLRQRQRPDPAAADRQGAAPFRPTASPTRRAAGPFSAPRSTFRPISCARSSGSLGRGELRPGLPVEVLLNVRKRTALQYMLDPLTRNFWRSLREQ